MTLALPFTLLGRLLGFVLLPAAFLKRLALILIARVLLPLQGRSAELARRWFDRNHRGGRAGRPRALGVGRGWA